MSSVKIEQEINQFLRGQNILIQQSVPQLVEKVLSRKEAQLTSTGAIVATTGKYTGRSPQDKYIVEEDSVKDKIDWDSNQPISKEIFTNLYNKVLDYLKEKNEVFVFKGFRRGR